jgi:two-component system chemotaxis response regulator CheB
VSQSAGPREAPLVIAIGASAGGLEALSTVLGALPGSFPVAIIVVQHLARNHPSRLAELIQSHSELTVVEARGGEVVAPGHVYVAPPDRHLEINSFGRIHLGTQPPVNFSRPSVDVLFRSLASAFGAGGVAVVLTGAGSDGARGAVAVHEAGGLVLVQDDASAFNSGMPGYGRAWRTRCFLSRKSLPT